MLSQVHGGEKIGRDEILTRMTSHPQQVEILITHCVYDGDAARRLIRLISVQYRHLSYLIPTLTAIEMRLQRLSAQHIPFPEDVAAAFRLFLNWLKNCETLGESLIIQQELSRCQGDIKIAWRNGCLPIENRMLLTGLLEFMADFVRFASAYQSVGGLVSNLSGVTTLSRGKRKDQFYGKELIRLSALTAFCATFGSCLLWIGTGWQDGDSAPMMAAILSSLFANMDTPLTSMKLFMRGVLLALFISLIYVVLLIPQATSFDALVICLTPSFILICMMIARPSSSMIGISVAIPIPGFIGLGHNFKPDLALLINNAIASLAGVLFAVVLTELLRNKRPTWTAR